MLWDGQPLICQQLDLGNVPDSSSPERSTIRARNAAARALEADLRRLSFVPVIVVDEGGYIPFDPDATTLMFSLKGDSHRLRGKEDSRPPRPVG